MALSKIHGQMLRENLLRDGDDVVVDNDLFYVDVNERRVGINTIFPDYELSVNGTINAGEIVITGNTIGALAGDIELSPEVGSNVRVNSGVQNTIAYFDSNLNLIGSPNLGFDGSFFNLDGGFKAGNVTISGTLISSDSDLNLVTQNSGNINLVPDVGGVVNIANINLTGLSPDRVAITSTAGTLTQSPVLRFFENTAQLELSGTAVITTVQSTTSTIANSVFSGSTWNINDPVFTIAPDFNTGLVRVSSSTAFGIPVGDISQRPVLTSSDTGMVRFNPETYYVELWDGNQWINVGPNIFDVKSQTFSGNGVDTIYTLDFDTNTEENIIVSINGVVQVPIVAYLVSSNQIQFADVLQTTDLVEVRYIMAGESIGVYLANPDVDGGLF